MTLPLRITVVNATKSKTVGAAIEIAETVPARIIGLLGRRGLAPGEGLLITPSSGIHTWGMRFSLDVVALDSALRVVRVWENLGSFRIAAVSWRTRKVLELPVGAVRRSQIESGDQLVIATPSA